MPIIRFIMLLGASVAYRVRVAFYAAVVNQSPGAAHITSRRYNML